MGRVPLIVIEGTTTERERRLLQQAVDAFEPWVLGSREELRCRIASGAMNALIQKVPLHDRQGEHGIHTPTVEEIHSVRRDIAESARDYADALLEALGR